MTNDPYGIGEPIDADPTLEQPAVQPSLLADTRPQPAVPAAPQGYPSGQPQAGPGQQWSPQPAYGPQPGYGQQQYRPAARPSGGGCGRVAAIFTAITHLIAIPLWIFGNTILHEGYPEVGDTIYLIGLGVAALLLLLQLILAIVTVAAAPGAPRVGGVLTILGVFAIVGVVGALLVGISLPMGGVAIVASVVHLILAVLLFIPPSRR